VEGLPGDVDAHLAGERDDQLAEGVCMGGHVPTRIRGHAGDGDQLAAWTRHSNPG
jgi:hypothetical protein